MAEEKLRTELYDSFKNRALVYHLIFDELRTELGAARAEEILSRAIYRRGQQKGREQYARFAPGDLAGLKAAFLATWPTTAACSSPKWSIATRRRWTSSSTPVR